MIFSELYSAYYQAIAAVLKKACAKPVEKAELRRIVEETAFGESILNIEPALLEERWPLLKKDGTTPIRHAPSMPLTLLQKRWLKSISLDPRIRLFCEAFPDLEGVKPLFTPEDVCIFDRYLDGDPYEEETYIRHFRMVLDAVRTRTPLSLDTVNRKGNLLHRTLMPEYLEYSQKDDKFRLIGQESRYGGTVNLARIVHCEPFEGNWTADTQREEAEKACTVVLEVTDRRNALERVLMHFAHFRKEAERIDALRYRVSIDYDLADETEMVIRILSFGPMVKVVSPDHFVDLIKERLRSQMRCAL